MSLLWRFGPDWLKIGLIRNDVLEMLVEYSQETKTSTKKIHSLATTEIKSIIGEIVDFERFTAYVLRAVKEFKTRSNRQGSTHLSTEELTDAEQKLIEDSQVNLSRENSFESLKCQLNLFLDEKLWRCGGRLTNADLPYSTKYPLLLLQNYVLTRPSMCTLQWGM